MSTTLEPPDGRERRKLATRRALRSATLDLGLERGLHAAPIEEIAARAGVSTRTFFNYFETKEDAALLDIPGITDEQLARLTSGHGAPACGPSSVGCSRRTPNAPSTTSRTSRGCYGYTSGPPRWWRANSVASHGSRAASPTPSRPASGPIRRLGRGRS